MSARLWTSGALNVGQALPLVAVFRPTLARLEAGVGLANDIDPPATFHDLAVTVAVFGFFQGGQDFHGRGTPAGC